MTRSRLVAAIAGVCLTMLSSGHASPADPTKRGSSRFEYPPAPKSDTVDNYHGAKVADPYRPLEDLDAPSTRAWIEAENKITSDFLEKIPARAKLKSRLTKLWDYEKYGIPSKEGDRYFFSRNTGLQNQSVIYTTRSLEGEPKVLLDPNGLSSDGTVALAGFSPSDDGSLVAYGTAAAGSDWQEWRVRESETAKDLSDRLQWIKFSSASWTKDGKGFYYGRFPEPKTGEDLNGANYNQKLYFHKLGTAQSEDKLIYERPDHKDWQFHGTVTDDGKYLVITVSKGTDDKYRILYQDLTDPAAKPVELIDNFEHEFSFIDNDGSVFWFKTDVDAPRRRVIAIDVAKPARANWKEVIPQAPETLEHVSLVDDRFFASYLKDAHTQVNVFDLSGKLERVLELPELGTASGFGGKRRDNETFYTFTSFSRPPTVYRHDPSSGKSTIFKEPKVAFDPANFETKQVFYKSKDGTRIPMFLSYKKGTKLDTGQAPTFLYGYGGFNIPLTPTFNPATLAWMELGGIHAVANLRGGGEYGEEWHKAGTKLRKQNVFDDFISAAEWLISHKVTSTPKLAIEGRSNGGLLVGAVMTQRPELFGAAMPGVGVMDMLRFHKFTIGWAWVDDYGSSDDPDQFQALYKYSPLHNIKPGTCYPPTLVITADHDDRVVPAHSFKFAAALQAAQSCDNPALIRIETKAGHGAGKPTTKVIDEAADKWAFLVKILGVDVP
jgi:prolyl oligopeptidase